MPLVMTSKLGVGVQVLVIANCSENLVLSLVSGLRFTEFDFNDGPVLWYFAVFLNNVSCFGTLSAKNGCSQSKNNSSFLI